MTQSKPIDYDGRRFRPVPAPGQAGTGTAIGHYHQDGDLVWAEFAGDAVRVGRLVGTYRPDGAIDAAYCYVTAAGEAVAGTCVSVPSLVDGGRVLLTERWQRADGAIGVSYIEEVKD